MANLKDFIRYSKEKKAINSIYLIIVKVHFFYALDFLLFTIQNQKLKHKKLVDTIIIFFFAVCFKHKKRRNYV